MADGPEGEASMYIGMRQSDKKDLEKEYQAREQKKYERLERL